MKWSRRKLLEASLGVGQVALLSKLGVLSASAKAAPSADLPSRFLSLYIPGGIRLWPVFVPFSADEVNTRIPPPSGGDQEPIWFTPDQVIELAPGTGGFTPLRMGARWDPAQPNRRGDGYNPMGYAYKLYDLASHVSVLHGVNQGTAAHSSATIAAMCGIASDTYRSPAMASWAAVLLSKRLGGNPRPLPCVCLTSNTAPVSLTLPATGNPVLVPGIETIRREFSTDPSFNYWWGGGLNERRSVDDLDFRGASLGGQRRASALDLSLEAAAQKLAKRSAGGTAAILEQLYGRYKAVSRVMATDISSTLESTLGSVLPRALHTIGQLGTGRYGHTRGSGAPFGGYDTPFEMILKLFKSDLATSIHATLEQTTFDLHNGFTGQAEGANRVRGSLDGIGRLLGEMKATPAPGKAGKSLLDDTLVVIFSEFSRSFATGESQARADSWLYPDDHHPISSVVFAGAGIAPNRQIGSFKPNGMGVAISMREEDGRLTTREPNAADVVSTALCALGFSPGADFFIPGGYGSAVDILS